MIALISQLQKKHYIKFIINASKNTFPQKSDRWYEDSRAAYTGKNSIKFHEEVPESIHAILKELESGFQAMREELEFYETDYRTKMLQSK